MKHFTLVKQLFNTYLMSGLALMISSGLFAQQTWDYNYTGSEQSFIIPSTGYYQLEVWGAQGGNDPEDPILDPGGRGGYSTGEVLLTAGTTIYIYVGSQGTGCTTSSWWSTGGGGATDMRLVGGPWDNSAGLYSRIIVAGGGGGRHGKGYESLQGYIGNDGGGLSAPTFTTNGTTVVGANQTGGGSANYNFAQANIPGSFGFGNPYTLSTNQCSQGGYNGGSDGNDAWACGGSGGGWYGGCTSWPTSGGGSGYVYTSTSVTPAGYTPIAAYQMINEDLIAGNASMPDPSGGLMTGKTGNGFARITQLYGVEITGDSSVSCNGASDASLTAAGNGGQAPYTFIWSTGATTASITNLSAGVYSVTMTDNNGATSTASDSIAEPSAIITTFTSEDVSCANDSDGSAMATTIGGVAPYAYDWSNSATGHSVDSLAAGLYTITITDSTGCTSIENVTVGYTFDLPVVNIGNDTTICVNKPITLDAGNPGASYAWSTNDSTQTITTSTAGSYMVTVTDGNGCINSAGLLIEVDECLGQEELFAGSFSLYPNPSNGQIYLKWNGSTDSNARLVFYDVHGKIVKDEMMQLQTDKTELIEFTVPQGHYVMKLITQGETYVRSIIVQ